MLSLILLSSEWQGAFSLGGSMGQPIVSLLNHAMLQQMSQFPK